MERIIKYSKPSSDIVSESSEMIVSNIERAKKQVLITEQFSNLSFRKRCVCCGKKLYGAEFSHRGLVFLECEICNHIQSKNLPTPNYPNDISRESGFDTIYPGLCAKEYESRTIRIYKPKLDWLFDTLINLGYIKKDLINKKWIEIGSGAGNFMSACATKGIKDIVGIEVNQNLVSASREHNPQLNTIHWKSSCEAIIKENEADILCSFFVLEHINDLSPVWEELSRKPKGSIFVFSVPVFGLSTILEDAFPDQFARNLDGVVHTQLFTDDSIEYAMKTAGHQIYSEWIFGQDTSDLVRFLTMKNKCKNISSQESRKNKTFNRIYAIQDKLQAVIDKNRLSDQRHILAIKK